MVTFLLAYAIVLVCVAASLAWLAVSAGVWITRPNRRRVVRPGLATLGTAIIVWALTFVWPFGAQLGGDDGKAAIGSSAIIFVLLVAILAAQRLPTGGAFFAGVLLFGAVWAYAVGYYAEHAVGWQGLTLKGVQPGDMGRSAFWLAPIFFSPVAFAIGEIVGFISPRVVLRREP